MKRFRYSTVEISGIFGDLEAIIFKWTAKPTYDAHDHNFYLTKRQEDEGHTQEDIALEGHPRIEERIKRELTKIYGKAHNMIYREYIQEFEREVLSKFFSNKTSIERVEQDLYEFLDVEVPKFKESKRNSQKTAEVSTDKSDVEFWVLKGHPIVCKEYVGIGVAEPLMSSIFADPGKFKTNVMFPGVCRTVYNSEIGETINELGIRLATRREVDSYTKDMREVESKMSRRLGYAVYLPGSSQSEIQHTIRNLDAIPDFEEKYELIKFLKRYLMVIS